MYAEDAVGNPSLLAVASALASGKDWVRISAWDVAANGAFTQPVRLSRTVTPTAAAR